MDDKITLIDLLAKDVVRCARKIWYVDVDGKQHVCAACWAEITAEMGRKKGKNDEAGL